MGLIYHWGWDLHVRGVKINAQGQEVRSMPFAHLEYWSLIWFADTLHKVLQFPWNDSSYRGWEV